MKTDSDPQGWRIAGLVVLLAAVLTGSAYYIHTKVYCDPAHPMCIKTATATESHAPAADHGAATDMGHGAAPAAGDHAHPADSGQKAADTTHKTADTAHKAAGGGAPHNSGGGASSKD